MATNLWRKTTRLVGLGVWSNIVNIQTTISTSRSVCNSKLWSVSKHSTFPRRFCSTKLGVMEEIKNNDAPATATISPNTSKEPIDANGAENDELVKEASGESVPVEEEKTIQEEVQVPLPQEKKEFLRRKKMVVMLSYCGQNYLGMQRNPGAKTIEDDLLQSLLKAGYIDDEAYKTPRVMQFQRAARTDKHVSAARQIVSLKVPDVIDICKINSFLPPEVRVMGAKKVTKGFDCKINCDARTYMYMIPTFAFTPIDQDVTENYKISPEVLENLRTSLKLFLGTKNFHNFTSRRKPTDPSSKRFIISFTASDPFVKDGLEYLILRVKGQSFMLHQIRKMIGLVVAYLRGFAGTDTFTKAWELERIDIPKAPGVGLVLDHVHYERYNQRYGTDGMHSMLTWDEVSEHVEDFCQKYIYPVITKTENEEKSMFEWLTTLPYHTYDVRRQITNVEVGDEDNPISTPKEYSGIGWAALAAEKVGAGPVTGLEKDDEGEDSDEDAASGPKSKGKRGRKSSSDAGEEDDDDDNEFVQAELSKRRRLKSS